MEEQELLHGTSLKPALDTKRASLEREFELLRQGTEEIPWCQRDWWDVETGRLTFNDWRLVDAMYRSRALDLPGTGHSMVPCVDMANHASGHDTGALYETDPDGNALLQLRWGQRVKEGEEVTITYGDEKGAAEMIFSYGFLESTVGDARQLFLDIDIPDDDPLKPAKRAVCDDAPGVRIFTVPGSSTDIGWESPFIWWACVNEEDGLEFRVLQSNDGERELKVMWKEKEFESEKLRDILKKEPLWDIFCLRAVVTVQQRVSDQIDLLHESREYVQGWKNRIDEVTIRRNVWDTIMKLRELEEDFLTRANDALESEKTELVNSPSVQQYLRSQEPGADIAEDFS